MRMKKTFAGASMLLALLINCPQVYSAEVETFGEDFDDENSTNAPFKDEDLGAVLIFNDPEKFRNENPAVEPPPVENPQPVNNSEDSNANFVIRENPQENYSNEKNYTGNKRILPPSRVPELLKEREEQKKLKTQKARFIKLAMDDDYLYYLDKQSVAWKRVPYLANEYMLDVWIRMIERNVNVEDLPEDLAEYVNDTDNGEIEVAKERGRQYKPSDVEVLQHKKYFLQHYYLRPKTKQIQFLCELEIVGHPQNTVSERAYDYKNWENLIPGSMESILYNMTIKEVGKSGASDKGHMSFADMLDEYARISIR